jgi:hemerythrin
LERLDKRKKKIVQISANSKSPFFWRTEYSINVQEMDNHHKKLFVLAENIYISIKNNNSKEILEKELDELVDYTIFHFNSEEKLLENNHYPILEEHQKKHSSLIRKVKSFKDDINKTSFDNEDLIKLLRDWILNHIFDEDRKYGKYLNEKAIF